MQEKHGAKDLRRYKYVKKRRKLSYEILSCKPNELKNKEGFSIIEIVKIEEEIE